MDRIGLQRFMDPGFLNTEGCQVFIGCIRGGISRAPTVFEKRDQLFNNVLHMFHKFGALFYEGMSATVPKDIPLIIRLRKGKLWPSGSVSKANSDTTAPFSEIR